MLIQEDYVSFETAKLLKEKGFNSNEVGCHGGFYSERCYESGYGIKTQSGQEVGIIYDDLTNSDLEYDEYLRPTLQMAMKWLRKKHNIHIEPRYFPMPNIYRYVIIHSPFTIENIDSHPQYFNTHEEACEEAIKYCLENLII